MPLKAMQSAIRSPRPFVPFAAAALAASLLAGCNPLGGGASAPPTLSAPTTPVRSKALDGPTTKTTLGTGKVHVAMVLPMSNGIGKALRNAAELSLDTAGASELTIQVKDDHGTPDGARDAAQQAMAEGNEIIIGPLFADSVRAVSGVARGAGKPVVAFSTDSSTAAHGVYLLSFLIETYVDRIVSYVASTGKKSIAALVPENTYGNVALAEFQQEAARVGLRVVVVERYTAATLPAAAQRIGALGDQIDSLFIPEQADAMAAVSQALVAAKIDVKKVQVLGTGVWNDARVLKLPALQGAWFSSPDNTAFNAFSARYKAKYGSEPPRIASLGYDAVSLVAALARVQGNDRYTESSLTTPQGFVGTDGVFRFRVDGLNDRGLAVQQIADGTTKYISPAPRSLAGSGT